MEGYVDNRWLSTYKLIVAAIGRYTQEDVDRELMQGAGNNARMRTILGNGVWPMKGDKYPHVLLCPYCAKNTLIAQGDGAWHCAG
jgi:hypothetical protein